MFHFNPCLELSQHLFRCAQLVPAAVSVRHDELLLGDVDLEDVSAVDDVSSSYP